MDAVATKLMERLIDFGLTGLLLGLLFWALWVFGPKLIDRMASEAMYLKDKLKAREEECGKEREAFMLRLDAKDARHAETISKIMEVHERTNAKIINKLDELLDHMSARTLRKDSVRKAE